MAMTRETKLGIGVSCTFACLVCLIVGFKLYEEPAEDSGGGQAQAPANTQPAPPAQAPPPDAAPELVRAPQIEDPDPAPPPPFQPTYGPATVVPPLQPLQVPTPPVADATPEAEPLVPLPLKSIAQVKEPVVPSNFAT